MKLAIQGLGKMGMQIAEKLVKDGHQVITHNRSTESIDFSKSFGATAAYSKEEVIKAFGQDRVIVWLMVPAKVVKTELETWLKIMPKGSLLIDGGNSDFRNTKENAELVVSSGSSMVDVGVSGGIQGLARGFSMMVGGEERDVEALAPALVSLAKPNGAWKHFGPSGAGHYVKMVHNAIEYGIMESIAEGYQMLEEGPYKNLNLSSIGEIWQKGSIIASDLNGLAVEALTENPKLEGIEGFIAESGEARWALEVSEDLSINLPSIQAAFDVRLASQQGKTSFATKLLAELRNKFGGHAVNKQ
jgi:6-phosphogluconate dehydrogenase